MARTDVKEKILRASKSVFSGKGYKKATVADILSEAGIARATFYKYFPSKHEVFFELFRDMLGNLYEDARSFFLREAQDAKEWESTLRKGLSTFYRFFLENRDIILAYYSEAFVPDPKLYALWDDFERKMISLFMQILDSGVERGAFRPMDTNLVANILLMIFLGVPNRYIMTGGRSDIDIESIAHEMVKLASEGMVARTYRA
ncbi:MAG: TetR/AcrR family transcriptional regulator [Actinobacteria bacterium]|nr:TetR/AcrR family transcriptional regulator [Actinomycetota bacterium]